MKERIVQISKEMGYSAIGFTDPDPGEEWRKNFQEFLEQNRHGEMHYLRNHLELRLHPQKILPECQTVVALAYRYEDPGADDLLSGASLKISRYALGRDYHRILRKRGKQLLRRIQELNRTVEGRVTVDTAPVPEKVYARRAGLGFQGRNTNLIHPELGSYFFLSLLFLNIRLEFDRPIHRNCGSCRLCEQACPAGALEDGKINAQLCISYLNLEKKESLDDTLARKADGWLSGCDICQEVCPYNQKESVRTSRSPGIFEMDPLVTSYLKNPYPMDEKQWDEFSRGKSFRRSKRTDWNTIIKINQQNSEGPDFDPAAKTEGSP